MRGILAACVLLLSAAGCFSCPRNDADVAAPKRGPMAPQALDNKDPARQRCLIDKKSRLTQAVQEVAKAHRRGRRARIEGAEVSFTDAALPDRVQIVSDVWRLDIVRHIRGGAVSNVVVALPKGRELETLCDLALDRRVKGARVSLVFEN